MDKFIRLVRLPPPRRQRAAMALVGRALRDERGGEVMEYAIVAGLDVVGAIASIGCVGAKLLARWTSLNSSV